MSDVRLTTEGRSLALLLDAAQPVVDAGLARLSSGLRALAQTAARVLVIVEFDPLVVRVALHVPGIGRSQEIHRLVGEAVAPELREAAAALMAEGLDKLDPWARAAAARVEAAGAAVLRLVVDVEGDTAIGAAVAPGAALAAGVELFTVRVEGVPVRLH